MNLCLVALPLSVSVLCAYHCTHAYRRKIMPQWSHEKTRSLFWLVCVDRLWAQILIGQKTRGVQQWKNLIKNKWRTNQLASILMKLELRHDDNTIMPKPRLYKDLIISSHVSSFWKSPFGNREETTDNCSSFPTPSHQCKIYLTPIAIQLGM